MRKEQLEMAFNEKNVMVSLTNFSLILVYFAFRVIQMINTETFTEPNVFRLWIIVILLAVLVTVFATILTHILIAILEAIRTQEEPEVDGVEDERDELINLRGTRATYVVYSIGVLAAMLTFYFGYPPLVMFTLLVFFGILSQIIGDLRRLRLYRRGL
jgi:hypothetical protein